MIYTLEDVEEASYIVLGEGKCVIGFNGVFFEMGPREV